MRGAKLLPAFRHRFFDTLRGAAVFFGVMFIIFAFTVGECLYLLYFGDGSAQMSGNFNAYGFAAAVTMFVFGICTIREDLRLMVMCGVGRRTVFLANLLNILAISAVLSVAGALLIAAAQALTGQVPQMYITDLYQLFFKNGSAEAMTFIEHLQNVVLTTAVLTLANLCGMFLSLLFYRLPKAFRIVVAIAGPLLILNGIPAFFYYFGNDTWLEKLFSLVFRNVWTISGTVMIGAGITVVVNWLLLRRAPVRAANK